MAKIPVDRILLSRLNTLPTFSGSHNEDVIQWLKDIIDELEYVKFTDDQKISFIVGYLEGDARRWLFQNVLVLDSWSTFVEEFTNEFATTLLQEDAVSQVNQSIYVLDQMICCNNDIKEKQQCELFEEKEVHPHYFSTKLVESNNFTSFNRCIMEDGEDNCETAWPDGCESWFIHNVLPQRCQFVESKQHVFFNSTSNIYEHFSQKTILNCVDVFSPVVVNEAYMSTSYNIDGFGKPLTLHAIYNNIISFFLFLGKLSSIIIISRRIFIDNTTNAYFCCNVIPCDTEDRDWFRHLAVP